MNKLLFLFVGVLAVSGLFTFVWGLFVPFDSSVVPMVEATPYALFLIMLGTFGIWFAYTSRGIDGGVSLVRLGVGFVCVAVSWAGLETLFLITYP